MNPKTEFGRIELYHFGDCGSIDEFNPFYVFSKNNMPEILFLIANCEPYTLKSNEIAETLQYELSEINALLVNLKSLNMITEVDTAYAINFPIFLERDLPLLDRFSKEAARKIGDTIIHNKKKLYKFVSKLNAYSDFDSNRLLYHIVGDYIFDGTAIDYFGTKDIFKISKEQPGDRDYILIGFEVSEKVFNFSNKLLCSSNNYRAKNVTFNSFGDSDGNRKDLYRFYRQAHLKLKNLSNYEQLNLSYIQLLERQNQLLAEECAHFINRLLKDKVSLSNLSSIEKTQFEFLQALGYLELDDKFKIEFKVPVFYSQDKALLKDVSDFLLSLIEDEVNALFHTIKDTYTDLSAVKHGVNTKEISNELWHQVFGNINEYLVENRFFEKPDFIEGEGRYFQCLYID